MQPGLGELQKLLYRLITATSGVEEGLAAEKNLPEGISALVRGDARASAVERVEIYANMYFYRLLDAIKEDFPATFKVLGEPNFHNLITGYLAEYPPGDPSINEASRHLAEFAIKAPSFGRWPFLADLIRLERALIEVFLGPDAEPLTVEAMSAVPAAQWQSLRFAVQPGLQLLCSEWRVDELIRAVESEQPVSEPRNEPGATMVWRNHYAVDYRALDDLERSALGMIRDGYRFGAVCEAIATQSGDCATTAAMSRMLLRWLVDGVLVRTQP
jgi:hypothetical protein